VSTAAVAILSESVDDCCPAVLLPHDDKNSTDAADKTNNVDKLFIILFLF
jgi:hypothetical protein